MKKKGGKAAVVSYRIVLADDHAIFRQGMRRLIEAEPGLEVIGEAKDGHELFKCLDELEPELAILDISMPKIGGVAATREISRRHPGTKILILTMHRNKEYLYHAISAGAQGYLLKEDSDLELFSAIEAIRSGGFYVTNLLAGDLAADMARILSESGKSNFELLTSREKEILKLIAEGHSNRGIADRLNISIRTVENHRANVNKKLRLNKTADLVKYAIQQGMTDIAY